MEGRLRELSDGEVIFRQNEPSDFACIIEDGVVEVFCENAEGDVQIALLDKGQLLGEMGVIDGRPRSASARAKGAVRIREYESRPFLGKISQDPTFASSIMTVLVSRLRRQTGGVQTEAPALYPPIDGLDSPDGTASAPEAETGERKASTEHLPSEARPDSRKAVVEKFDGFSDKSGVPVNEAHTEPAQTSDGSEGSAGTNGADTPPDEGDGSGPQRSEPTDGPSKEVALKEGLKSGLPIVLISPLENDPEGVVTEAFLANLDGSEAFNPITLPEEAPDAAPSDDNARQTEARRALAQSGATIAVLGSVVEGASDSVIELQFVTAWPDEESRIGGFSVFDRFYATPSMDDSQRQALHGIIRSGVPGRSGQLREVLEEMLPSDLPGAKKSGALSLHLLKPAQAAQQLTAYGNAAARKGQAAGRESVGLEDAADAYQEAIDTAPDGEDLLLGLAYLHRAIVLSSIAEREKSERHREMAEKAVKTAADLFDPKKHRYQYLTANARHGAILYRSALQSGSVERCKKGIESFNKALAVCDKTVMQDPWADTMNGLGQLLILVGRLSKNTDFLGWASQVCKNAMEVRSRVHNPLGWARTLNNRATALYLMGRAEGSVDFLKEAMAGFDDAMEVFEQFRIASLVQTAKNNRGLAEAAIERLDTGNTVEDREWWAA